GWKNFSATDRTELAEGIINAFDLGVKLQSPKAYFRFPDSSAEPLNCRSCLISWPRLNPSNSIPLVAQDGILRSELGRVRTLDEKFRGPAHSRGSTSALSQLCARSAVPAALPPAVR